MDDRQQEKADVDARQRSLPALTKLFVALRISNPGARILACGHIVSSTHSLVGVTGADAVAADFERAVSQMERLLQIGDSRQIWVLRFSEHGRVASVFGNLTPDQAGIVFKQPGRFGRRCGICVIVAGCGVQNQH